eukprot:sb/3461298/
MSLAQIQRLVENSPGCFPEVETLLSTLRIEHALSGLADTSPVEVDDKSDPFGDGDQSMVFLKEKQKLQTNWASGFDYNPENNTRLSSWCRACATADIPTMERFISEAREKGTLTELLERRESKLRFCAILMIICGARQDRERNLDRFVAAAKMVIDAGCRVDCKDVAGYSAIHHCFTMYGNKTSQEIAKLLVAAGANINAQNRFGYTALHEPVMHNMLGACEFLLKNGIDPSIKDNDGVACTKMVHGSLNIPMSKLFSESYAKMAKEDRGSEEPECVVCQKTTGRLRNCAQCLKVKYCGPKCQKKHWPAHKEMCRGLDEEGSVTVQPMVFKLQEGVMVMRNHIGGEWKYKSVKEFAKFEGVGKLMKVKIQIPLSPGRGDIMVYNKGKKYQVMIPSTDPHCAAVHAAVVEKGYAGVKAYFLSKALKSGELTIDLSRTYAETWMRSILVTGANRGIGLELVRHFARQKDPSLNVISCSRRVSPELEELMSDGGVHHVTFDVTNPDTAPMIEAVAGIVGDNGLNVLVNNAAIMRHGTGAFGCSREEMMETLDVNVTAVHCITTAFHPLLKQGGDKMLGKVINISSELGSISNTHNSFTTAYRVSKAALNMLSRCTATDLIKDNVICLAVHPGWVRTDLGGPNAPLSVEDSCRDVVDIIERAGREHNGMYADTEFLNVYTFFYIRAMNRDFVNDYNTYITVESDKPSPNSLTMKQSHCWHFFGVKRDKVYQETVVTLALRAAGPVRSEGYESNNDFVVFSGQCLTLAICLIHGYSHDPSLDRLYGLILLICAVFGVIGNILSFLYFRHKKGDVSTTLYRAITVLDVTVCALSFSMAMTMLGGYRQPILFAWTPFCQFWAYAWLCATRLSVFLIVLLSTSRTISMCRPFLKQRPRTIIIAIGIYSVFILINIVGFIAHKSAITVRYYWFYAKCIPIVTDHANSDKIKLLMIEVPMILSYIIPLFIVILSCVVSVGVITATHHRGSRRKCCGTGQIKRTRVRATNTIMIFTVLYIVCNSGMITQLIIQTVYVHHCHPLDSTKGAGCLWNKINDWSPILFSYWDLFARSVSIALNATFNPLIYLWRMRSFRIYLVRLYNWFVWGRKSRCQFSQTFYSARPPKILKNPVILDEHLNELEELEEEGQTGDILAVSEPL